jgi:hypothetical protein
MRPHGVWATAVRGWIERMHKQVATVKVPVVKAGVKGAATAVAEEFARHQADMPVRV